MQEINMLNKICNCSILIEIKRIKTKLRV